MPRNRTPDFSDLKFAEGYTDYEELRKGNVIIQLVNEDDYGNPYLDKAPYSVGDEVTFTYADEYEYVGDDIDAELIIRKSHERTYTVAATAVLPTPLTIRRFGGMEFAMASEILKAEAGENASRMITAKWIWSPILGMLLVFLVLGTLIPVLACRTVERQSVVERLREVE